MTRAALARAAVIAVRVFTVGATSAACIEFIRPLSEARTAMVGVHNELNEVKLRMGIRTKMEYERT